MYIDVRGHDRGRSDDAGRAQGLGTGTGPDKTWREPIRWNAQDIQLRRWTMTIVNLIYLFRTSQYAGRSQLEISSPAHGDLANISPREAFQHRVDVWSLPSLDTNGSIPLQAA